MPSEELEDAVVEEFVGADLGDRRRNQRLRGLVERLRENPAASFPVVAGGANELQGLYRFLSSGHEEPGEVLRPHCAATVKRAAACSQVLVVHDTTKFSFPGDVLRPGLAMYAVGKQGFLGHFALAVALEPRPRPLGVLGFHALFRGRKPRPSGETRGLRKQFLRDTGQLPPKEFDRWAAMVAHSTSALQDVARPIHVMDREADAYELLATMKTEGQRFVVRASRDRVCVKEGVRGALYEHARGGNVVLTREVTLSARHPHEKPEKRPPVARARHPSRRGRQAKLACTATTVTLQRTNYASSSCPPELTVNLVRVFEVEPPQGCEPVEWVLITSEPIATSADVERVVDIYRARWLIEEYFRALKTGCAFEKRQLETRTALLNALAIFSVFAWQLLLLRRTAHESNAPASAVLTPIQLEVLRRSSKTPLPDLLSAEQALLAVAQKGGHIQKNGPPGWTVLWRGFEKLLTLEEGYLLATTVLAPPATADPNI